jgi:RNA polymerase sigma-70 factor (ECF subfamily)
LSAVVGLRAPAETQEAGGPSVSGRLDAIYHAHFSIVWRGLRRLGVPECSIEDAVQDVFLIVHRRSADFEGRSSLRTWIYGIVVRVAKEYRRAEARHALRVERLAASLSEEQETAATPAEELERREANRLLHAVLATLADEEREVLVLVELEQLPVREAATALGIQLRTCQRRIRAARAVFETKLAELTTSAELTAPSGRTK